MALAKKSAAYASNFEMVDLLKIAERKPEEWLDSNAVFKDLVPMNSLALSDQDPV